MNEAFVAAVNGQFDTTALPDFSRDMVSAIRQEAGDQNHLVNLGTIGVWRAAGSQLPYYGLLLDCPADGSGGCTDLAEVHDYSGRPLHGIPLGSAVTAELVLWNDRDEPFVSARVSPSIDGWTVITGGSPGPRYRRWGLRLTAASGSAWSAYVDDAIVQTSLGPQVYSFETGTEGFTATGASVGQSSRQPKTGLASLRADVPASLAGQAQIQAPPIAAPASSISVAVRLTFAAPTAESAGLTMAPYFHEAVVSRGKPFFVGEAGIAANVIGASARGQAPKFGADGCVGRPSVIERALAFDAMMALQMDDEHGSSGLIAWDWKDPTLPVTRWDGAQIVDPTFNCYSIAPEDPAVSVFARWADQTPNDPPLPPPSPLPAYGPAFVVLQAPPAEVVNGSKVPLAARMTVGGDPLPGIRILSTGGCGGWGTTNALGFVKFSCMVSTSGTITITVAPDPASCGCTTPGTTYTVTSRDA